MFSNVLCLCTCFSVSLEELSNNIRAIQCTEVFEYGMSLGNASFLLPAFHLFKYLYLLRLIDYGFLEEVRTHSNAKCASLQF